MIESGYEFTARNSEGEKIMSVSPSSERLPLRDVEKELKLKALSNLSRTKRNVDKQFTDQSCNFYEWPAPFNHLFLTSDGDLLLHHSRMRKLLKMKNEGHREIAIHEAEQWVGQLTRVSSASYYDAVFAPKAAEDLADAQNEFQRLHGFEEGPFEITLESPRARRRMYRNNVQVTLCIGWLGYFWLCLLDDLRRDIVNSCKLCGSLFKATRQDKRVCSAKDNPECRRNYDRNRQRKSREK